MKYKVGYTAGTFDMFHIGHLTLLKHAKANCEHLIVGVNSDDLVYEYKKKIPVINEYDRLEIVSSICYVDETSIMNSLDKVKALKRFDFDVIFIGDDWKGSKRWNETEMLLNSLGVDVCYLPYTKRISSTKIIDTIKNKRGKQ